MSRELTSCRKLLIQNNIEFEQSVIISADALTGNVGHDVAKGTSDGRQFAMGA